MNCYNHNDVPGIAVCTSCGKALCKSCIQTSGSILACSAECMDKLQKREDAFNAAQKRSKSSFATSAFVYFTAGITFLFFGIYNLLFAILPLGVLLSIVGIVFLIGGFRYRKALSDKKPRNQAM